ncbi:MAG: cobyric acid synthase [Verrucomicrobiae bacterium]|nr:cobyric acid synthase [Verrucomicrobiae bacterium]
MKTRKRGGNRNATPALMVVGTMSHSGKSLAAAALCRYFARQGIRVAPFKAQNMALNSFVTREGGEMGRAQVTQARAAGVEPHTDMNPVLLKPIGNKESQIIVHGKPVGHRTARQYYRLKKRMQREAWRAYDRLAPQYELMVLEGAGSPAEINLLDKDFVNLSMAAHARAAVILVADIDRGGVFAGIFGTIMLLPEKYRRLIRGVVINKFRGDVSLLSPGIRQIERLTGIPVLGVLPFVKDLRLEEEDSLGLEDRGKKSGPAVLDLAVIRLPRMSNYTDFLALENTDGVRVRYVDGAEELERPDLVILPGTKDTRGDLRWLKTTGMAKAIQQRVAGRIPLIGICGGFQMLGRRVRDPSGEEGCPGVEQGLGVLPVDTVFAAGKELAQVEGKTTDDWPFGGARRNFSGYEIHMGRTWALAKVRAPLGVLRRGGRSVRELAGVVSSDGLTFGCYVHGLFDATDLRHDLLRFLCCRKGVRTPKWKEQGEDEVFNRLADLLAKHLRMDRIERWLGRRSGGKSSRRL